MFSIIAAIIGRTGVAGVFLLMLVENLFPALPSELILPMAGFAASRGAFSPLEAIVVATVGSSLGGAVWYAVGYWLGLKRLKHLLERGGRWVALTSEEVDRADAWFARHQRLSICLGRALPGVRGVICLPAGLARMSFWRFMLWSSLGAAVWSSLLVGAGLVLGARYAAVEQWLNPVVDVLLGLCLLGYLWRVLKAPPRGAAR